MKCRYDFPTLIAAFTACLSLSACKEQASAPQAHGGTPAAGHAHEDEHSDEVKLSAEAIKRYGIKIEPADRRLLIPTVSAPGRIAFDAEHMAHVGSPLRGRIAELKAKVGDNVKKGDPLLIIESAELGEAQSEFLQKHAAAQTAGPTVDLARSAHDRARGLYDKSQGIPLAEVQKREAELRAAEATVRAAQSAAAASEYRLHLLGMDQVAVDGLVARREVAPRFAITAPLDGQVLEREVTLGELVSPDKEALLILANMETLWVLADVPEARLNDVKVGAKARVTIGLSDGATIPGAVTYIAPALDPATRSAQVRIEVRGHKLVLRPGMFARVEIEMPPADGEPILAVPEEAVQTVEGEPAVFMPVPDEENTFAKRAVTVGRAVGGWVPILSGLDEGDSVVITGTFLLKAELGKGSAHHEH